MLALVTASHGHLALEWAPRGFTQPASWSFSLHWSLGPGNRQARYLVEVEAEVCQGQGPWPLILH